MSVGSVVTSPFTYDDAEQRIVCEQRHSEAQALLRAGLAAMIEAGGKYSEIRDRLRHNKAGGFDGWLAAHDLARTTAYRLIEAHAAFATVPSLGQLDLSASAAFLLAAPSTPAPARAEAVQRAATGERVTAKQAARIIAEPLPEVEPFATVAELAPAVRAWLGQVSDNPVTRRAILTTLTGAGQFATIRLEQLEAFVRSQGRKARRADLQAAAAQVLAAEPPAPVAPPMVREFGFAAPEPAAPAHTPEAGPEVVYDWLALLVDENELPDDGDAKRYLLNSILTGRSNGGALPWRRLRAFPGWGMTTDDAAKLAAVRLALSELTGQPVRPITQAPPVRVTPLTPVAAAAKALYDHLADYARRRDEDDPALAALVGEAREVARLAAREP